MIWLNWCINYISGQTTAHFHSDSALYPDSGLSQGGTVVFIPTVVYILTVASSLSDYSPQHSPHSYFHVIFISAYPAVQVQFYAYVQWFNNKLTYYFLERKAVCKPATINITTRREETTASTNANDRLGKGFDVLKDHVLNRLMTRVNHSSYGRSSTRFFSKIASILKKSATFKTLKSSLRMYWCKFQPWKRRLLQNQKVTHGQSAVSDRQSDYCNPLAHVHWGLIIITLY